MYSYIFSCLVTLSLICYSYIGSAQTEHMDMNELLTETQKLSDDMNSMSMAWWVPVEFWQLSFAEDPYTTEEMVQEYMDLLTPYNMIVVSEGTMGMFGARYKPKEDVIKNCKLIDAKGNIYDAIDEDDLKPDIIMFIDLIKPFFANLMGEMGENMHVLMFPVNSYNGTKIIQATELGSFTIKVGDEEFVWDTPIESFLAPKMCPIDKKRMSGGWTYCPYHGDTLIEYKGTDKKKKTKE